MALILAFVPALGLAVRAWGNWGKSYSETRGFQQPPASLVAVHTATPVAARYLSDGSLAPTSPPDPNATVPPDEVWRRPAVSAELTPLALGTPLPPGVWYDPPTPTPLTFEGIPIQNGTEYELPVQLSPTPEVVDAPAPPPPTKSLFHVKQVIVAVPALIGIGLLAKYVAQRRKATKTTVPPP